MIIHRFVLLSSSSDKDNIYIYILCCCLQQRHMITISKHRTLNLTINLNGWCKKAYIAYWK